MKAVYIITRGFALIMVMFWAALTLMLIANLNPKVQKELEIQKSMGSLNVFVSWPQVNADVDVWAMGPDEKAPVGFTHLKGIQWTLNRDDLGFVNDGPANFENITARKTSPGEYIINLFCFRCEGFLPLIVTVEVWKDNPLSLNNPVVLFKGNVTLTKNKQEKTVISFRIDGNDNVVPSSVLYNFKPLVSPGAKP